MTPAGYFRRLLRGAPTNENRAVNARTRRLAPVQAPGVFRFARNATGKRSRSGSKDASRSRSGSGKRRRTGSKSKSL